MKTLMILGLFLFTAGFSFAQDVSKKDVPSIVLNAFQQEFSRAEDISWKLKKGIYVVDFEIEEYENVVWITSFGKILQHEQKIEPSKLPVIIKDAIRRDFSGFSIEEAEILAVGEKMTYEIELENSSEERKVTFNKHGKVLENKLD